MKLPRRQFLHLAAGAAALPAISRIARAQAYPTKPVRLVVPFPPGGAADITVRPIAQWLAEHLGQPVVIENRPGGSTNVGTEAVVRAALDGYTLLAISSTNVRNMALFDNLSFNFLRDIAPVASTNRMAAVLVVNPSFAIRSVPELVAYAKANPGKINMASAGVGTPQHVYGELFKSMTGVDMVHVPYRGGGAANTDLLAGHVHLMFDNLNTTIEHVKGGTLRALAVTAATRLDVLPDIPAMNEFVPGFEASGWQGIGAPRDTPVVIINKLNQEINAGLADPKIMASIASNGGTVFRSSPAEFAKVIAEDSEKWAKVIRAANIKAE